MSLAESDVASKIIASDRAKEEIVLPEADIVVSGGRGMKDSENWGMLEDM